jgi:hypothetical protein
MITAALIVHLHINKSFILNTSSVYFALEKTKISYLSNRTINQIHFPTFFNSSLQSTSTVIIRVKFSFDLHKSNLIIMIII